MKTKCTAQFDEIKLIWRPAPHTSRHIVGTLKMTNVGFEFKYDVSVAAHESGFSEYPGLPLSGSPFREHALGAFSTRLPSREREDFDDLIGNWRADSSMSDFQILGLTSGTLPTDMYEFIPVIEPVSGTCFLSDLAGIHNYVSSDEFTSLAQGTELELRENPLNEFDPDAVEVRYQENQIAHLKIVHATAVTRAIGAGVNVRCFLERKLVNGSLNEVVVRVAFG